MLELGDEDDVFEAAELFDGPPDDAATRRFLRKEGHHLLIAHVEDHPVGFVSGVEITHPDKGTEMFLSELGVEERFRRRESDGHWWSGCVELPRSAAATGCGR